MPRSLFFNEVAGLGHRCFPVNFVKYLRTPFLQNTSCGCFFPTGILKNKKKTDDGFIVMLTQYPVLLTLYYH